MLCALCVLPWRPSWLNIFNLLTIESFCVNLLDKISQSFPPVLNVAIMKKKSLTLLFGILALSVNAQRNINEWPVLKHYDQKHLLNITLPLGSIGTGTVSLGCRG